MKRRRSFIEEFMYLSIGGGSALLFAMVLLRIVIGVFEVASAL